MRFGQAGHDDEDHQEHIVVSQQWYDTLTEYPFFSSKFFILLCNHVAIEQRGRTLNLLKEGTKVLKAKRQRKQHPVMLPDI